MTEQSPAPHDVVSLGVHILDVLGRPVDPHPAAAGHRPAGGDPADRRRHGRRHERRPGQAGRKRPGDGRHRRGRRRNFIVDTMERYGIDTSGLRRKPDVQTSATMLPIRPNGERPALHVLGANAELGEDDVDLDAIARARHLHFGGTYLMPKLDGQPTARILEFAQVARRARHPRRPRHRPPGPPGGHRSRRSPTSTTSCPASTKRA